MSTTKELTDTPVLIEKAALAVSDHGYECSCYRMGAPCSGCEATARAALSAVADDLRAEGAREALTGLAEEQGRLRQVESLAARYVAASSHGDAADAAHAYRDQHYPATEGER